MRKLTIRGDRSLTFRIRWPCWRFRPSLLLIAVAIVVNFLITGYQFAVWDQTLYLPLVNGYVDASVFSPHDAYVQGFLWKSYTTLFLALTPLIQFFGWEWPVFLAYVVVKVFLFLGLWALAFRLTRDHRAAALAVLFLVANTLSNHLSAQLPSSTLICRYVVMPFVLFGLERFLARSFRVGALLFGLAFQIHALTASFWLVLTVFVALFDSQRLFFVRDAAGIRRWREGVGRELVHASLICAAMVLPLIVWHALTPTPFPKDYTVAEWMEISRIKNWYDFISHWTPAKWEDLIFSFALIAVVMPRLIRDRTWRPFAGLMIGTIFVLGLHYLVSEVIVFRPLYQLQWIRVTDVPVLAGIFAVARGLARAGRRRHRWLAALAGAILFVVMTMGNHDLYVRIFTLAVCAGLTWSDRRVLIPALLAAVTALLLVLRPCAPSGLPPVPLASVAVSPPTLWLLALSFAAFAGLFYADLFRPALLRHALRGTAFAGLLAILLFVSPPGERMPQPQWRGWAFVQKRWAHVALPGRGLQGSWFDLQRWIRDHTPKGTLFFTPPGKLGFRVVSARSSFVEYSDGEVGIFDPGLAREWKRRMELIGYWPPVIGGRAVDRAIKAYHAIPPDRWIEMAREHHVDYLVTNRPVQLPFPRLYAVGEYTLWKIPDAPMTQHGGGERAESPNYE